MKKLAKWLVPLLVLAMLLTACGGSGGSGDGGSAQAPDLQQYYDDYMASLGEGNTPMMMDMTEDAGMLESYYPGLKDVETKQLVVRMPAITGQAFEFALAEAADAAGANRQPAQRQHDVPGHPGCLGGRQGDQPRQRGGPDRGR